MIDLDDVKRFKEIGGNFWFDKEQVSNLKNQMFNYTLLDKKESKAFVSSGRGAINLLLRQFQLNNKIALLPIYTCDSVVKPFLKKGFDVKFYDINIDLSVSKESLINKFNDVKPGVILFHSYFGFDTLKNIRLEFKKMQDNGIIIIEDITHSLFSDFNKYGANYHIASIRKWLEVPDGAVAFSTINEINFDLNDYLTKDDIITLFSKASLLKGEYIKTLNPALKPEFRKLYYESEDMLDNDYGIYNISNLSMSILSNYNFYLLKQKRRLNYSYLLNNLSTTNLIEPIFKELPTDVVPLYFPIYVREGRHELQKYLAKNEIYAPIHWPIPEVCSNKLTLEARGLYDHILSIPCDQRYTVDDMKRICAVFNSRL